MMITLTYENWKALDLMPPFHYEVQQQGSANWLCEGILNMKCVNSKNGVHTITAKCQYCGLEIKYNVKFTGNNPTNRAK